MAHWRNCSAYAEKGINFARNFFLANPALSSRVSSISSAKRGIHALGGWTRSVHDGYSGALDPADETCRKYERVFDAKYLDQIRTEARQFSNKLFSRQSGVARHAIINF